MAKARPLAWILAPALALALGLLGQGAAAQDGALPQGKKDTIEKAVSSEMARSSIPGLSLALVVDGEVRLAAGYGLADLENFVPAKAETSYRLASLTKPITAVAIMQLVERGQLELDATVQKYVPAFPEKQWPITTRQLLSHQSGIRHHTDAEWVNTQHFDSLTDSLQAFKDSPLAHEPGTKTLYSSNGYTLAGCVLEAASDTSYLEFVRINILEPAHMERTQLDDNGELVPNRARGYRKDAAGRAQNSPLSDTSNRIAGGGLRGTAPDMARFAIAFLNGDLLRKETVAWMLSRQKTREGKPTGYGLGWILASSPKTRECWHTGGQPQVSNILYLQPDAGLAVAILTNMEGVSSNLVQLARRVATLAR
jgi:serine beta-lactamase-like protein LACTB, mitochondrial